jgi:hypothetical protein
MRKEDKKYGLNFLVATQFATMVQLQNLTNVLFSFLIFETIWQRCPLLCFHIKKHVQLQMSSKKFNPKNKTKKWNNIIYMPIL